MAFLQICFIDIFLTFLFMFTDAENVTTIRATKGEEVHLPCKASNYRSDYTYAVEWRRKGSHRTFCHYLLLRTNSGDTSSCGPPYVVKGQPAQLYITKVNFSDSGVYRCFVSKLIPPPQTDEVHLVELSVEARPAVSVSWAEGPNGDPSLLCSSKSFYPESIEQGWLLGGLPLNVTPDRRSRASPDGSVTLDSYLPLTLVHTENVVYSCWVRQTLSGRLITVNYTFYHTSTKQKFCLN